MTQLRIIIGLVLISVASTTAVRAEDSAVLFSVSPQKCVTLKQGRVCYLDLDIEWEAPDKSEYCISWKSKEKNREMLERF